MFCIHNDSCITIIYIQSLFYYKCRIYEIGSCRDELLSYHALQETFRKQFPDAMSRICPMPDGKLSSSLYEPLRLPAERESFLHNVGAAMARMTSRMPTACTQSNLTLKRKRDAITETAGSTVAVTEAWDSLR